MKGFQTGQDIERSLSCVQINIRISKLLKAQVKHAVINSPLTQQEWIKDAIREKLTREQRARIDNSQSPGSDSGE